MVKFVYGGFKCKDCKDRKQNCHSQCESYQKARETRNRVLENQTKEKSVNYYFDRISRKDKGIYD